jgi:hypothetical protein
MAADLRKELKAFVASMKAIPTILTKLIVSESVNGCFNASYRKSYFALAFVSCKLALHSLGFFLFLYVKLIVFGASL